MTHKVIKEFITNHLITGQPRLEVSVWLTDYLLPEGFDFDKTIHNVFDLNKQLKEHYGQEVAEFIMENWN